MLTDTQLKSLKPQDKAYKVADALGLYVTVAASGTRSFRYDYRLDGKRETLTIGRYEEGTPSRAAARITRSRCDPPAACKSDWLRTAT